MSKSFVLLWMLFNHVFDDYHLQGILANLKQKSWWQDNAPQDMYKYDYIIALLMHSISWAFLIMLPIAMSSDFSVDGLYVWTFALNALIHALIDDLKANQHKINLVVDQGFHLLQIVVTYMMYVPALA